MTQLVIPMSGIGQRFIDSGFTTPKPLIEVAGKPMIEYVVKMFPGVDDILFIVNNDHLSDANLNLKQYLESIAPGSMIVGIDAWAVVQAKEFIKLDQPVIVNYCDFSCSWNFEEFDRKLASGCDGLIATYTGFHPHMLNNVRYAYVHKAFENRVTDIQEKDSYTRDPMSEEASSGTYGFRSGRLLLGMIEEQIAKNYRYNNEYYISLTYKNLIENGGKVETFLIEQFCQWGTPEDFLEFESHRNFFLNHRLSPSKISGVERVALLAAGAGSRFTSAGYSIPKPFLPINQSCLVLTSMKSFGKKIPQRDILLQNNIHVPALVNEEFEKDNIEVFYIEGLSQGQASSAKYLLEELQANNCVIATCDSILIPKNEDHSYISGKTLAVWTVNPNEFSKKHPKQFGWVLSNSDNEVVEVRVKDQPDDFDNWRVITGNFMFGNTVMASELITKFEASEERVNGEFYLDSLLMFAKIEGWKVLELIPVAFESLGTPDEYQTFLYWEKFFLKHPEYLESE